MKTQYKTISVNNERLYNQMISNGWIVINTNPYNETIQLMIKG